MTDALAIASLIAWAVVLGAIAGGGGSTNGWHVGVAFVLSIVLAVAVLV